MDPSVWTSIPKSSSTAILTKWRSLCHSLRRRRIENIALQSPSNQPPQANRWGEHFRSILNSARPTPRVNISLDNHPVQQPCVGAEKHSLCGIHIWLILALIAHTIDDWSVPNQQFLAILTYSNWQRKQLYEKTFRNEPSLEYKAVVHIGNIIILVDIYVTFLVSPLQLFFQPLSLCTVPSLTVDGRYEGWNIWQLPQPLSRPLCPPQAKVHRHKQGWQDFQANPRSQEHANKKHHHSQCQQVRDYLNTGWQKHFGLIG